MNAYSEDLRRKIVEAVGRGTPKSEVARLLRVSLSSVKRYARSAREGKPLSPRKAPGKRPKIGERARRLLEDDPAKSDRRGRSKGGAGSWSGSRGLG